jgi:hypothetical protein
MINVDVYKICAFSIDKKIINLINILDLIFETKHICHVAGECSAEIITASSILIGHILVSQYKVSLKS